MITLLPSGHHGSYFLRQHMHIISSQVSCFQHITAHGIRQQIIIINPNSGKDFNTSSSRAFWDTINNHWSSWQWPVNSSNIKKSTHIPHMFNFQYRHTERKHLTSAHEYLPWHWLNSPCAPILILTPEILLNAQRGKQDTLWQVSGLTRLLVCHMEKERHFSSCHVQHN